MRLSWKLGRVAGIDLFLHPSALLLFFVVPQVMPSPLGTFAFVVALLASIVLHELGHALMARRYGIGTEDITLYLIGGVARLRRMPRSAGPELLIALAGPAVNLAIVGILAMAMKSMGVLGFPTLLIEKILILNLGLAAFNLLPIFPMDGGRVFRALLSGWLGRTRATEVAATFGQAAAVIGGFAAIAAGNWELALLCGFVFLVAGIERFQVLAEQTTRGRALGLAEAPASPAGFRWVDRGDGVLRLSPNRVESRTSGRSWI